MSDRFAFRYTDGPDVQTHYLEGYNAVHCDCCAYEAPVQSFRMHSTLRHEPERDKWLCEVCATTFAGTAHEYPDQYRGEQRMMAMVAWCTNHLLARMGQLKETL